MLNLKQFETILEKAGVVESDYAAYLPVYEIKTAGGKTPVLFIDGKRYIPSRIKDATYEEYENVILKTNLNIIARNHPKQKAANDFLGKINPHLRGAKLIRSMYDIVEDILEFNIIDMDFTPDCLKILDISIRSNEPVDDMEEKLNAAGIPVFFQTKIIEFLIDWK